MGLSGPKKKTKISNDPNNTKWARSTSGFGHRIMSSQGWAPGNRLGARDAAHADYLTSASNSHIRVTIKDDTLGLGAKIGRENEPTGLDAFKGLLGRLNGKSDVELKQEQRKRDDVKLARYAAMKFPAVRFVYAGPLAQEKEEDKISKLAKTDSKNTPPTEQSAEATQEPSAGSDSESESSTPARKSSKSKSKDKSEKSKSKSRSKEKSKSSKKSRSNTDDAETSSVAEPRKEKKSKKRKADAVEEPSASSSTESSKQSEETESATSAQVVQRPVARERRPMSRQIFRGRHIAQKKKALMDDKSLNEIFMIKA